MFEKEIDKFSALIHTRENNHVMGTSPVSAEFLKLPAHLGSHEKEALSYFLPLADWIRKDLKLVAPVFEKILKLKKGSIEIKKVPPFWIKIEQESIDDWRVDLNMVVGGEKISGSNCYEVRMSLKDSENIEDYLESGFKKQLLKTLMIPNFIHSESEYKLKIRINESAFEISENKRNGRIGISSII